MFQKAREILKKKEIDKDKQDMEYEKGDFLALFIAAVTTMLPVLLAIFAFFALLIWLVF